MAQNSFEFYAYTDTDGYINGSQVEHSSLTDPLTTGDTYCRNWSGNTDPIKVLLTGSDLRDLDGTRAVSLRAKIRLNGSSAGTEFPHVFLVAKTSGSSDGLANRVNPQNHVGYLLGIDKVGDGVFNAYNGTSKYDSSLYILDGHDDSVDGVPGWNNWYHFRMDVEPISSSGGITGDEIRTYYSTDDGTNWQNIENITLESGTGFIPWSDPDLNRYGLIVCKNVYVDDFQIFLSEES